MIPDSPAFFEKVGDSYHPLSIARGPWRNESLSGAALSGLLGYALDREHIKSMFPARFTADFLRPAAFEPLSASTRILKQGENSVLAEVLLTQNDSIVARASTLWIKQRTGEPAAVWRDMTAFHPPAGHPGDVPCAPWFRSEGYSDWTPVWSDHQNPGRKSMWHHILPVVSGEQEISRFSRATTLADSASFVANWGTLGVSHMNIDLSVSFARLPAHNTLGLLATQHLDSDGHAVGCALMLDADGPFAHVTVCSILNSNGFVDFADAGLNTPPS